MGIIKDAIDTLFGREKPANKVMNNGRVPVMWGVNNQGIPSLKSLAVWLNGDGSLRVGLQTHFAILKKNYIVNSALRFFANRIWWYWFYFVDKNWVTVEGNKSDRESIERFFDIKKYVYESLAFLVTAWQKVSIPSELNQFGKVTKDSKIINFDPRMLTINTDPGTWDILEYIYSNTKLRKTFSPDEVYDYILYPDLDRDSYGLGIMDSVVIDILTDIATSNRQLYLYMNNATPWTVYLVNPEAVRTEDDRKDLETKINEKYGWNSNIWKPLISSAVVDVKTIEIPTLDVVTEREHIMKIVTTAYGVDPRVLWFMKDRWWSYAEIDAIARNMTNWKIEERAGVIENIMNHEYSKRVKELPYKIKLDNIYFKNVENDKKMSLEEVKAGIITAEEYKTLYDL